MIRNLDTENLILGDDDEFYQKLEASKRLWLERIRMIPGTVRSIPRYCWSFLKFYAIFITELFLRKSIAIIVFFLGASGSITSIIVLRGDVRIIIPMYCFAFICCSLFCLVLKRGWIAELKRSFELLERQQLIANFDRGNGQEAGDQPTGYGAKDKRQPLQRGFRNLTGPRPEGDAAGPSSAPQCFSFTTSTSGLDSDEPSKGPFVARLHPDAINFFGPPDKVFGADSYIVVHDPSDEV